MSAERQRARLAALLSVEPQRLAGLEALSASHVTALRGQVSDVLHAEDAVRLGPIVGLIAHVPAGLAAGVVEHGLSPRAVARLAAHLDEGAAADIVERLSADYMAEVAFWLEHDRCGALLAGIPPPLIAQIALRLAADERWATMAGVAEQLPDASLEAAAEVLDEGAISAMIGFADSPTRRRILRASASGTSKARRNGR